MKKSKFTFLILLTVLMIMDRIGVAKNLFYTEGLLFNLTKVYIAYLLLVLSLPKQVHFLGEALFLVAYVFCLTFQGSAFIKQHVQAVSDVISYLSVIATLVQIHLKNKEQRL